MKAVKSKTRKDIPAALSEVAIDIHTSSDLDQLIERAGDAKVVMLGEGSHGTHEYYIWRARITRRLVEEKGFNFIGVEGDWPDCYKINRYIKDYSISQQKPEEVLSEFERWPTWMWANWEIAGMMEWLKDYNTHHPANKRVGFYGMDVYSLWESMDAVMDYLKSNDPAALKKARKAAECFLPFNGEEGSSYARKAGIIEPDCEKEVADLLAEIRKNAPNYNADPEAALNTEQNASIMVNAEKYYRSMISGGPESWNIRDRHMAETLDRLMAHHGPDAKAIIWEHNTHIGDAKHTDMVEDGLLNIGQLARKMYGESNCYLVGFGSYEGTVIAGDSWGANMQEMEMPPAKPGSWEDILHNTGRENSIFFTRDLRGFKPLNTFLNHRAVGVVYRPNMDDLHNYVPSDIPHRYDAFHFIDTTSAVHPLLIKSDIYETPSTYPWEV